MSSRVISRAELYELVWLKPMVHISKSFGTSAADLRELCVTHDIPLPKAGHWMQVAAGKSVVRPKLSYRNRYQETIQITRTVAVERPATKVVVPKHSDSTHFVTSVAPERAEGLSVSAELVDPHPLVVKTLTMLARYRRNIEREKKIKEDGSIFAKRIVHL